MSWDSRYSREWYSVGTLLRLWHGGATTTLGGRVIGTLNSNKHLKPNLQTFMTPTFLKVLHVPKFMKVLKVPNPIVIKVLSHKSIGTCNYTITSISIFRLIWIKIFGFLDLDLQQ